MPRRGWHQGYDDAGYPYIDEEAGYTRNPYEDRVIRESDRANNPHASPRSRHPEYDRFSGSYDDLPPRYGTRDDPNPLLTLSGSPRQREREMDLPPEERRGPYSSILRGSETPEPRLRGRRHHRIDRFGDTFGDLDRPERGSGEDADWGARGPPRDPFRGRDYGPSDRPYGGGAAPRNPFRPGGGVYDWEREEGERYPGLAPPDRDDWTEQARRRDDHYRGQLGEPWGLAEYGGYQGRRRHEERVLRERERSQEREINRGRRSLFEGYGDSQYGGDEDDEYEIEGSDYGDETTMFSGYDRRPRSNWR